MGLAGAVMEAREAGKGMSRGEFSGETATRVLRLEEEGAGSRAFLPLSGNHGVCLEVEEVQQEWAPRLDSARGGRE